MDGFDQNTGVILIAATNRPDVLDPALLRPGRFDRQIVVDRADFRGREKILEVHARNKPLSKEVSLETLAKRTPGFSGADLENLLNEAALLAARRNKNIIEMNDCDEAIDRVMVGPERKSIGDVARKKKRITAYHESGHAILGGLLEKADPVHKVTIIPRGMALGITWSLPEDDRHQMTREELLAQITMALGGRLAEEIQFGDVTTGASNDFEKATELARRMVTQYGMSELGPIQFGRGAHQVFLGRDFGEERNYSEEVASKIDGEVRRIIESCYERGRTILTENWDKVERMVKSLLEYETVDAEEVRAILEDKPYDRDDKGGTVVASDPGPTDVRREEPQREKPSRLPPTIRRNRRDARGRPWPQRRWQSMLAPLAASAAGEPLDRNAAARRNYMIYPRRDARHRRRSACGSARRARATTTRRRASRRSSGDGGCRGDAGERKVAGTLIRGTGGRVAINVYPDIVDISATFRRTAARRVVAAMSAAYFSPAIDDDALKIARTDVAVLSAPEHYAPDDLLHDALFAQLFAAGPAHFAPIPARSCRPQSHYARRKSRVCKARLPFGERDVCARRQRRRNAAERGDRRRRRARRTRLSIRRWQRAAAGRTIDAAFRRRWALRGPGRRSPTRSAATALDFVADYLFRDETGVVSKALDPTGDAYVNGQFITLHDPGVMLVTIGGSKPAGGEAHVLSAIAKLYRAARPAHRSPRRARRFCIISLPMRKCRKNRPTISAGTGAEGNATYAPSDESSSYWKAARSLDPQFVASIVKKYLAHPVVVRLITTASKEPTS